MQIRKAQIADMPAVRELMREYASSLNFELCFQGFDEELGLLPGVYAEPEGAILVLEVGAAIEGVVALKPIGDNRCEMKRLFLRESARGKGWGRELVNAIIAEAIARGYSCMCLDTVSTMAAARKVYTGAGFIPTEPYCYNPLPTAEFMELQLR